MTGLVLSRSGAGRGFELADSCIEEKGAKRSGAAAAGRRSLLKRT